MSRIEAGYKVDSLVAVQVFEPERVPVAADATPDYELQVEDAVLRDCLELASEAVRPLVKAVFSSGAPVPAPGYELTDETGGRVLAEAELAWEEQKVVVLMDAQRDDEPAFENAGWTVFVHPADADAVSQKLRASRD